MLIFNYYGVIKTMSLDYKNDLEISVDMMDRNGIDYRTQLLDALDRLSAMQLETNKLKQRLKLVNLK